MGPQASGSLMTLSSWTVLEKAGQGDECSNLDVLENSSCPHSEQTYIPGRTKAKLFTSHVRPQILDPPTDTCTTHLLQSGFYILLHQRKSNMPFQQMEICFATYHFITLEFKTVSLQIHPAWAGKILLLQIKCPVRSLLCKMFPFLPLDGSKWLTRLVPQQTAHFSLNRSVNDLLTMR